MPLIQQIYNQNFLEYASYVIKDRAIPHLDDGLKPVQRRIIHSLFEMDDGKFHKVANVVGHCMKYHPHGDASIYSALVVLANKDLLIDRQGNFGNIFTGDEASAARYIECRVLPLAKEILYNPQLTTWEDSYDGRNREPVTFPSKLPLVLVLGAEGIAVGMATKILPHNTAEILKAMRACVSGKKFELWPDFPGGGIMDVSDYQDGNGKVLVRARLDTSDPKRIVIREIPFGCTTESLIESVEAAARKGVLKIAGISDFTTENVEIEIRLQRGSYASDIIDALYAYTDCEVSIPINLLVIRDGRPTVMGVSEIIAWHSKRLTEILKAELELEAQQLEKKLFLRTIERIFIEERIYKNIENKKTAETVSKAIYDGFKPFKAELVRALNDDDIAHLLAIPIRRISLYDINKARDEMEEIRKRLKEIAHHLAHLKAYTVSWLDGILAKHAQLPARRTEIGSFQKVTLREAAQKNLKMRYDAATGYLGTEVLSGEVQFPVTEFDRVLVIRNNGIYAVHKIMEKLFVDKNMRLCQVVDKDSIAKIALTVVFRDPKTGLASIKRCSIDSFLVEKSYHLVPDGSEILFFTTDTKASLTVHYQHSARAKTQSETLRIADLPLKGAKTAGVRIGTRPVERVELAAAPVKKAAKAKE